MNKVFIIAEIGSNHDQSLKKAKKLIKIAKDCGADAVKFQLFKGTELYPDDIKIQKIIKKFELNPKWIDILNHYAKKLKIIILYSAFDVSYQKLLLNKGIKYHKIASSEVVKFEILELFKNKKLNIFLSTGMCDLDDVVKAYRILKNNNLVIMQCSSLYPCNDENVNLNVIKLYKKKFRNVEVGFSDHTTTDTAALVALGLGARYFEKHITENKKNKGPDHFYAYEPKEFINYVKNLRSGMISLGSKNKEILPLEKKNGRRLGIYSKIAIKKNEIIKKKHIYFKFPAIGLRDKEINQVLNKKSKININKNKPIFSKMVYNEK